MPTARHAAVCGAFLLFAACGSRNSTAPHDVAVEVGSVAVDRSSGSPVVILQESAGDRSLPIWIGFAEAHSIASEIEHRRPPRPNTHDLAKRLMDDLEGALQRVVVTELRDGTYYAVLFVAVRGDVIEVDARPSDAIALALRCGAPVFVREPLFDEAERATPPTPDEHST
jgi:bifunctional DNase/RNase